MNYIKGSDGLLYEDLASKLLGEPAKHPRNINILAFRKAGREEEAIRVYSCNYDEGLEEGWSHDDCHNYANGGVERAGYRRLSNLGAQNFETYAQQYAQVLEAYEERRRKEGFGKKIFDSIAGRIVSNLLPNYPGPPDRRVPVDRIAGRAARFIVLDDAVVANSCSDCGIGEPDDGQATAASLRAAYQSALHGRLGAPGHLPTAGEIQRRRSERPLAAIDVAAPATRWEIRVEQPKLPGVAPRPAP